MKNIITTSILALLVSFSHAQYSKILAFNQFSNLEHSVKDGYGSLEDPIESGAFVNIVDEKSKRYGMIKLFNSYRWPNGDRIDFSKRFSTPGGSKGVVDCYTLINPKTKDTVMLYVDPYKTSEKYYVPKGLVALSAAILKPEIGEVLDQIQEINDAKDPETLKLHFTNVLRFISMNYDVSLLLDDNMRFVFDDKEVDKTLVTFLMRSYMYNKFYAIAKDIKDEKVYAFSKVKASYKSYIKAYPEIAVGTLAEKLD